MVLIESELIMVVFLSNLKIISRAVNQIMFIFEEKVLK
jgi:hypothetical protein